MPEHPTISIKVSIAPQVARGLHALVLQTLTSTATGGGPARGGDVITNSLSGTVHGTVFQIGKVHGQVNDGRGR